jgi:hypothetical protein
VAQLPDHGAIRRYRSGCRCDECKTANTTARARERVLARERSGLPAAAPSKRLVAVPTADEATVIDVEFSASSRTNATVESTLKAALDAVVKPGDLVAEFGRAHALALARLLDDPDKSNVMPRASSELRAILEALLAGAAAVDGEAHALDNLFASFGSRR